MEMIERSNVTFATNYQDNQQGWQKTCFFYLKQNIVFFILNSFFCLKHVLNQF
jgi:hypothetical protein